MSKVILISHDLIAPQMAGPAIRYWEMARSLSSHHEVILFCPNDPHEHQEKFKTLKLSLRALRKAFPGTQALISQVFSPLAALLAKKHNTHLYLDAYDPEFIEHLEIFKDQPIEEQRRHLKNRINTTLFSLKIADRIYCANARQKDLWLGLLCGLKKIDPLQYAQDPHLKELIDIIPFGMSSVAPVKTAPGLKEAFGLPANAKVLVWGGGIWNWFDPLTLLKAIALLKAKRTDIHLIFLGIKHPNKAIPEMRMTADAVQLAKELNIYGQNAHFNFNWLPYGERQNTLLEADIGVSTHFDNIETHYSFRTRILDYLWAELPVITTEGDCFADLVIKHELGLTVPYQDPQALARAIETLADDPAKTAAMKRNIQTIKAQFYWDELLKPLRKALEKDIPEASLFQQLQRQIFVVKEFVRCKGVLNIAKYLCAKR